MGDIFTHNGSALLAMVGKNCVAIAADTRLGVSFQTVSTDFRKVFRMNDKVFVGLAGLATDIQTLHNRFQFQVNTFKLNEERDISVKMFSNLVSTMLYEKRFGGYFVEPVIAGLDADNNPYICGMDGIGAIMEPTDFLCAGTATEGLMGVCESFWKPDLNPEELHEVVSSSLLAGINRDALSGWGAVIYIITPEGVRKTRLKARQD